jgi:hypothetical protein
MRPRQDYSKNSRLDEAQLCKWLGATTPGDKLCYHRGVLAVDCDPVASRLDAPDRRELCRLAKRALMAVETGFAHLVQRRNGPDDFSYLLVARPRLRRSARTSRSAPPSQDFR